METNEDKFFDLSEKKCVPAVCWIHNLPYQSVALHNHH